VILAWLCENESTPLTSFGLIVVSSHQAGPA